MKPTMNEVQELEEWLKTLSVSAARAAALGAVAVTLKRLENGHSDMQLTSTQIADEAGHDSFKDPDKARKWLKQAQFPSVLATWHSRQANWLTLRGRDASHVLTIMAQESRGGRGNQKTFEIVRVPLSELAEKEAADRTTLESEETVFPTDSSSVAASEFTDKGRSDGARIHYDMAFCGPSELSLLGRLAFGQGHFRRGSWRWRIHAANFVANALFALLLFIGCVVLPLSGVIQFSWSMSLGGGLAILSIYWQGLRPWLRTVDDRIRMADESMLKGVDPAQLEIWRSEGQSEWRLVRYTANCPVCASLVTVQPGEPDFPRRLVGRCSESPREHVFSFDRITRLGRALIQP